jgi:S1-C subfamily serine protease
MIRILFLWLALLSNTPAIAETSVPQSPVEVHLSFAPLLKQAAPAVVNIYARRVTEARSSTHPASPLLAAGFQEGDVITAVAGMPINTPAEMVFRMSVSSLNQKVPITRWRNGKSTDIPVSLVVAPEERPWAPLTLEKRSVLPGVTLATINPAVISDYNLSHEATGVLVTDPGSIGPWVGPRHGDLVLAVNSAAVFGLEDVRQTLRRSGQTVSIEILRSTRRAALTFRR